MSIGLKAVATWCVALSGLIIPLLPGVLAGTASNPEIVDPSGDVSATWVDSPYDPSATDLVAVWLSDETSTSLALTVGVVSLQEIATVGRIPESSAVYSVAISPSAFRVPNDPNDYAHARAEFRSEHWEFTFIPANWNQSQEGRASLQGSVDDASNSIRLIIPKSLLPGTDAGDVLFIQVIAELQLPSTLWMADFAASEDPTQPTYMFSNQESFGSRRLESGADSADAAASSSAGFVTLIVGLLLVVGAQRRL